MSTVNVDLLKRVLARIEKEPRKFNMGWFYNRITKQQQKREPYMKNFDCGTVCCFAGDIILEALGPKALAEAHKLLMIRELAQTLLGVNSAAGHKIFFVGEESIYPHAELNALTPGTRKYAKTVTASIRKFFAQELAA